MNVSGSSDNLGKWLTALAALCLIGVIAAFLIIATYGYQMGCFAFIGFNPNKLTCKISTLNDDWSTFSSLLSGSFSMIAGLGTLGVLLISMKQFKVQQSQIKHQNKRQEIIDKENKDREIIQLEFIKKQKDLLSLQIKKIKISEFLDTLDSIEKICVDYKFSDKINTFENFLKNDEKKEILSGELFEIINTFNMKKEYDINAIHYFYKALRETLNIEYISKPKLGDVSVFRCPIGFNIHTVEVSINRLNSLIYEISRRFKFRLDIPNINIPKNLKLHEIISIIDKSKHYQHIRIESNLNGYIHLVLFIFEMTNSSLGPPYRNLLSIEHQMYGIDDFYNNRFTLEFIKKARIHIDTYCTNSDLLSKLNSHLNNFASEYNN
ncbi:hypothetical protein ABIS04_16175 [Shewanella sp. H8]|uniref:hypothetical protein n=1 Tax=Shewanella sp. H8 TaxID=3342676 RepID=UPI0033153A86